MKELVLLMKNRFKIVFKNKLLWFLFFFILLFFSFVLITFIEQIETKSKLPIALVDEDNSKLSNLLHLHLKENEVLNIIDTNKKYAMQLLKNSKVEAVYQIPKDYEKRVLDSSNDKLIKVYYLNGSSIGKVVSDIFASEMLFDICTQKTLDLLKKINENNQEKKVKESANYFNKVIQNKRNACVKVMNIKLDNRKNNNEKSNIENTLIYQQVIIGLMAVFIAFLILFAASSIIKDKELGTYQRLFTIINNRFMIIFSDILSIWILGSIISCILSLLIIIKIPFQDINQILSLLILFEAYVFVIVSFFVMCSIIMKKIITLQVVGAIILIIFAIIGGNFWTIDLLNPFITNIIKLIPNYLLISGYMQLMTRSEHLNICYNYAFPLLFLGCIFAIISIGIQKKQILR